jgi:hypothetical protein
MTPDQGTSSGITQLGHARARGFEEDPAVYSGYPSSGSLSGSLNSPPQLSGPGMPGTDYRPYQERPGTASASIHRPDPSSSNRPYTNPSPHAESSRTPYSISSPRPITTGRLHDREFSRTLPPLNFGTLQSRGSSATGLQSTHAPLSLHSVMPPYRLSRPSTPQPSFAHQLPESFSRSSTVLPPPFTLQPAPQWDNSMSTPVRLEPLAGSRLCPLPGSNSPIHFPDMTDAETVRMATTVTSRTGRYDPVRAAFIHTTSTSPSPSLAQETGGGSDVGDDCERP